MCRYSPALPVLSVLLAVIFSLLSHAALGVRLQRLSVVWDSQFRMLKTRPAWDQTSVSLKPARHPHPISNKASACSFPFRSVDRPISRVRIELNIQREVVTISAVAFLAFHDESLFSLLTLRSNRHYRLGKSSLSPINTSVEIPAKSSILQNNRVTPSDLP